MARRIVFVQCLGHSDAEWSAWAAALARQLTGEVRKLVGSNIELFCYPTGLLPGDARDTALQGALAQADLVLLAVEPMLFSEENTRLRATVLAKMRAQTPVVPLLLIAVGEFGRDDTLAEEIQRITPIDLSEIRISGGGTDISRELFAAARAVVRLLGGGVPTPASIREERTAADAAAAEEAARGALKRCLGELFRDSSELREFLYERGETRRLLQEFRSTLSLYELASEVAQTRDTQALAHLLPRLRARFTRAGEVLMRSDEPLQRGPNDLQGASGQHDASTLLMEILSEVTRRQVGPADPAERLLHVLLWRTPLVAMLPNTLGHEGGRRGRVLALTQELEARELVGEGLFLGLEVLVPSKSREIRALREFSPTSPRRAVLADLLCMLFRDEVELRQFLRLDPGTRFISAYLSDEYGLRSAARAVAELLDSTGLLDAQLFARLLALFPQRRTDSLRAAQAWSFERDPQAIVTAAWRDRLVALLCELYPSPGALGVGAYTDLLADFGGLSSSRLGDVYRDTGSVFTVACQVVTALEDMGVLNAATLSRLHRHGPAFTGELRSLQHQFYLERAGRCLDERAALDRLLGAGRQVARTWICSFSLLLAVLFADITDATMSLCIPEELQLQLPRSGPPVVWASILGGLLIARKSVLHGLLASMRARFPGHGAALDALRDSAESADGPDEQFQCSSLQSLARLLAEVHISAHQMRESLPALLGEPDCATRLLKGIGVDNCSVDAHAWRVTRDAARQNVLDAAFFANLARQIPRRRAEIERLRDAVLASVASEGLLTAAPA